jgi:CO/xanthine dehydrogenase Mo-binding subunit
VDTIKKARGETRFVADLGFDHMLHGKILWSKYPHAEVIRISTERAKQIPGVKVVLTADDIPGINRFGVVERDQPVLAEKRVRYIGEPVAVVFAEDGVTAKKATRSIEVEYREFEGVFSTEAALAPGAPLIHQKGNVIKKVFFERGEVETSFAQADVVIQESFSTPPIEQAFIETEGALAIPGGEGKVTVYAGNQSPFEDRDQLASILRLRPENVRVCHVPAGGAFGGKSELSVHAYVALAALHTNRPARIILTRSESLRFHPKKHGFDMTYRIAAQADGTLVGMDVELVTDGGAYASWSPVVIVQASAFGTGPYFVPNLRIKGTAVYTNNLVGGAMRGFGVNQVHFALESAMDILAQKLGIDPIELRKRNAIKTGHPLVTGQVLTDGVGYEAARPEHRHRDRELLEERGLWPTDGGGNRGNN